MNINCTFLLQMLNFTITYIVFSRFVLTPAYMLFQVQKRRDQELSQEIEKKEQALKEQEKLLHQDLLYFQQHVRKDYKIPTIHEPKLQLTVSYDRQEHEIEKLVDDLHHLIIKEVPRVR